MALRRMEGAVAAGLAGWAVARLTAADRLTWAQAWTAPLLALTPGAAAAAWAGALVFRGGSARAVAALAGAALTAAVAPRALPRRQPEAGGPVLRVLTQNMLIGRAPPDALVEVARTTAADVLFVQELTDEAADRLQQAGIGALFPHQMTEHAHDGVHDTGIYARYPLHGARPPSGWDTCRGGAGEAKAAEAKARQPRTGDARTMPPRTGVLDLPSGHSVGLVCIHIPPPKPPWSPRSAARWREALGRVPPPGDLPMIVAGDFNATVDHAPLRGVLRLGYRDAACEVGNGLAPTWGPEPHGHPPLLTIDHVLVGPGCAVLRTAVHRIPGIDHRALYAEVRLPG